MAAPVPTWYDFTQDGGYTEWHNITTGLTGASGLGGMTTSFAFTKTGNGVVASWPGFSWSEATGGTGPAVTVNNVIPLACQSPNPSYFVTPVLSNGTAANGTVLLNGGTMVFYNENQTNFVQGSNGVYAGGIAYNLL